MTTITIPLKAELKTEGHPSEESLEVSPPSPPAPSLSRYRNEDLWSAGIVFWSKTHPELSDPPEVIEE
jgi:hypothetical protein